MQWAPTTQETAEAASGFDFFRVDENLVLIYAPRTHELFTDADDHFVKAMSPEEMAWLKECIDQNVREKVQKHPEKVYANNKAFMEAFEKELAKEKELLERKEGTRDGYNPKEEGGLRC